MKKCFIVLFVFFLVACEQSGSRNVAPGADPQQGGEICGVSKESLADLPPRDFSALAADGKGTYVTPTRRLPLNEWPVLEDDLDFESMSQAIARQLHRYKTKNLSGTIVLGGVTYPLRRVPKSLERFLIHSESYQRCLKDGNGKEVCLEKLNRSLRAEFDLFMPQLSPEDPRYGEEKQTFFTAYYTPLLRGRSRPDSRFAHAVYKNPKQAKLLDKTRVEIDFQGALANRGLEVFYAEDLFDLYLLHVQGGGRVLFENKSGGIDSFYISYDGTNGKSWRFISKYMADKGYINDLSIESQRKFLRENPDKQKEIYDTCPSYVFFKESKHPPFGNDSVPLTDNRSIATDTNFYQFKGLLSYVATRRPKEDASQSLGCKGLPYRNFSRFYLDQDTGGAIRGKARVDLYYGEGPYAELAAYNTKERGDLYFLMLKNEVP